MSSLPGRELGNPDDLACRVPRWPGAALRRRPRPVGRGEASGPTGARRLEITLLSGPAIVVFLAFVIFPVVLAAYYGFFSWKGYGPPTDFVGLDNYLIIFKDSAFHEALLHNGFIVVLSLVIQGPAAVVLALLLNQKIRGRSIIRVLIFVPYVISEVIVGTGWSLMLQTTGAVNDMLEKMGLGCLAVDWLSDPDIAIWSLMVIITLEVHRLRRDPVPRRPAEHPRGALRGGRDRRRLVLADPADASRCRCSARRSASGRSCRSSARSSCSTSSTSSGASTSPRPRAPRRWRPTWSLNGRTGRELRLRQRRRRRAVPDLARHRAGLPALRAAPGHRGRAHRKGRSDGDDSLEAPTTGRRRSVRRLPKVAWGSPMTYFIALPLHRHLHRARALHHPRRVPHQRADHRRPVRPAQPVGDRATTSACSRARCSGVRSANSAIAGILTTVGVVVARAHGRASCWRGTSSSSTGRCTRCSPPA